MEVKNDNLKEVFSKAYDDFGDAIFRYCKFQTSNHELALDLTADTFTKTWEYLSSGKEVDNLRAFLYRVANNLIIDYRRKKKSDSLDAITEAGFDIKDENDEKIMHENAFEGKMAMEAVQKLDENYRDVLIMRFVEDMSVKEISKILNEKENNISVRIHRALEKLKNLLSENKEN
ncbi:MAG: sigma-70 family RNA polymerase sigma factor [Candidatus Nomurabacteria bacterium]|nr:sigma-70 family RNA polymerase sigma factor [Candidatus Nomurabacteria bacterium]